MVKDALATGKINVFAKGKHFRPIVDVTDIARAYVIAIKSKNPDICGQIFNLSYKNYQVIDIAKEVKKTLYHKFGMHVEINIDKSEAKVRNYRISTEKMENFFKTGIGKSSFITPFICYLLCGT